MPVCGVSYRHRDLFSITSCDPIFHEKEQEFLVLFHTRFFADITNCNSNTNKQTNKTPVIVADLFVLGLL